MMKDERLSEGPPRMGRHNLASGVSHWFGFQTAQAPDGAAYSNMTSDIPGVERYAAPPGLGSIAHDSRGLRPWLKYAAAPRLGLRPPMVGTPAVFNSVESHRLSPF